MVMLAWFESALSGGRAEDRHGVISPWPGDEHEGTYLDEIRLHDAGKTPVAYRSADMHFLTRAPPMARPTCSAPSDICAAQRPGGTNARAEATCRRAMCVTGGQVPLGTLVRVFDLRLYRF